MTEPTKKEFPALEARKGELEHSYYEAKRQAEIEIYEGKPAASTQQWAASIRAELDELAYVLKWIYGQLNGERPTISRHALIAFIAVNMAIIGAIIYLYMRP